MRFLLTDDLGRPYRPTEFWVMADPLVGRADDWKVSLTLPRGRPPGSVRRIDDLKDWMVFQQQSAIFLEYAVEQRKGHSAHEVRRVERDQVFARFLAAVRAEVGQLKASSPLAILMPNIQDDMRRKVYEGAIQLAAPGATILHEPEMVVEYFHLVRREVALVEGQNSVFLVIDVGAATCNMSLVLSRRDYRVVDTTSTRQRVQRLRAIRGDSNRFAGRWVDTSLARKLQLDGEDFDDHRQDVLTGIEQAKIQVSRTLQTCAINVPGKQGEVASLRVADLEDLCRRLWKRLEPLVTQIRIQLFDNLGSTEFAQGKFADRLTALGITGPGEVHRLIDGIFLAGGTSQLPGFEEAMRAVVLPDGRDVPVYRVGAAYAVAAATGALAHILRHRYKPPRFRAPRQATNKGGTEESEFSGTLPADIVLSLCRSRSQDWSNLVVLPRDHAVVERGGMVQVQNFPGITPPDWLRARLLPDNPFRREAARETRPERLTALRANPTVTLKWDADLRVATLHSSQLDGAEKLRLDMNTWYTREQRAHTRAPKVELQEGMFAMDQAPDLVLDIGMSKTVVVLAQAGVYRLENLEALAEYGKGNGRAVYKPDLREDLEDDSTGDGPSESAELDVEAKERAEDNAEEPSQTAGEPAEEPVIEFAAEQTSKLSHRHAPPDEREHFPDPPAGPEPLDVTVFAAGLKRALAQADARGLGIEHENLTALLLALSIRPNVLLAGPPGCGKSTLVRVAARLLGLDDGDAFHEIPVQAHWKNDRPLFDPKKGLLLPMLRAPRPRHLVLFDEVNLARPEYFLARFFHAQERYSKVHGHFDVRNWLTAGSLNIDDTSRPPSPKVVDRCFLLELEAARAPRRGPRLSDHLGELPVIGGLPQHDAAAELPVELESMLKGIDDRLQDTVRQHHLRHDLLPSRRAYDDIRSFVGLAVAIETEEPGLLSPMAALDRAIESRLLVRAQGAVEQVQRLIEALTSDDVLPEGLSRSRRRLALYRQQMAMGFVSPWH